MVWKLPENTTFLPWISSPKANDLALFSANPKAGTTKTKPLATSINPNVRPIAQRTDFHVNDLLLIHAPIGSTANNVHCGWTCPFPTLHKKKPKNKRVKAFHLRCSNVAPSPFFIIFHQIHGWNNKTELSTYSPKKFHWKDSFLSFKWYEREGKSCWYCHHKWGANNPAPTSPAKYQTLDFQTHRWVNP